MFSLIAYRFTATLMSKIKFSVSGLRRPLDKHLGDVELTIDDLLKACDNDGGIDLIYVRV